MPDGRVVQQMFAEVAPGYDRANRLLSLGIDQSWRRRAVRLVGVQHGELGLDACTGTGDLALALRRSGATVVGADFCAPMLGKALRKGRELDRGVFGNGSDRDATQFVAADTLALPFADATFDFATVAFGIRNVSNPAAGLAELRRIVRPGGRVVVLEFCRPAGHWFAPLYRLYFGRILPVLGGWISGARRSAYQYLHDSVMQFPERADFVGLMEHAGLVRCRFQLLTGGIAALYRGEVPTHP